MNGLRLWIEMPASSVVHVPSTARLPLLKLKPGLDVPAEYWLPCWVYRGNVVQEVEVVVLKINDAIGGIKRIVESCGGLNFLNDSYTSIDCDGNLYRVTVIDEIESTNPFLFIRICSIPYNTFQLPSFFGFSDGFKLHKR